MGRLHLNRLENRLANSQLNQLLYRLANQLLNRLLNRLANQLLSNQLNRLLNNQLLNRLNQLRSQLNKQLGNNLLKLMSIQLVISHLKNQPNLVVCLHGVVVVSYHKNFTLQVNSIAGTVFDAML